MRCALARAARQRRAPVAHHRLHVVGVTTKPTIFASAMAKGDRYDGQMRDLAELGGSTDTAIFTVTTDDVRG
jgi:transaldolase